MTPAPTAAVQSSLTLVVEGRTPRDFRRLVETVERLQALPRERNPVVRALDEIQTVHFARFVLLGNEKLAIITTYDGSFEHYILDFVAVLHGVFDQLLAFVDGWPRGWSVADHPDEFLEFVRDRDLPPVGEPYSAYPDKSVVAVRGAR